MTRLRHFRAPDEDAAGARTWDVVQAAYRMRTALPAPPPRRLRPLIALVVVAALAAGAASPPGRAVLHSLRKAVGVQHAAPELFRLPAGGRLLVGSTAGAWVVSPDGSKRLLRGWSDPAWSPFGRYVVAHRRNELGALDPEGHVRWTLSRPAVGAPSWGGARADTRVAYLSRGRLHVVGGDGKGDAAFARAVAVAPAWRPGKPFRVAYVGADGGITVTSPAAARETSTRQLDHPRALAWSSDGALLLAVDRRGLHVLDRGAWVDESRDVPVVAAAFRPHSHGIALLRERSGTSELVLGDRVLFRGTGQFTSLAWSPDGKWLLVAWPTADQWVFVRVAGRRRIVAVSNVTRQFGGGAFPKLAGWCCSGS